MNSNLMPQKSLVPSAETSVSATLRRRYPALLFLLCALTLLPGCSRSFWRQHADRETYRVLAEKMTNEEWWIPRTNLEPDPRSRFYDPYDPDKPPLPPDDPAAFEYMEWVHGMLGYQGWHEFGQTMTVENPQWLENFGVSPEAAACGYEIGYSFEDQFSPPVPVIENMTMGDAIELTYINSRDFQFQLEQLYLTALELTFQRFRYDVQFLGIGGNKPTSDVGYVALGDGDTSLAWDNRIGISKLLPSGGQWAIELANNTLWLFSGDNKSDTASALSFNLVQPLLLGGGRKVALESLTQSERDALYAMRDFARFRKTFFVDIVSGAGGYLQLIGLRQGIFNQETNIRQLEVQIRRLRAVSAERPSNPGEPLEQLPDGIEFPDSVADRIRYDETTKNLFWLETMSEEDRDILLSLSDDPAYQLVIRDLFQRTNGEVTPLDVAQLETELAEAKSTLARNLATYQNRLDTYKIQMGIPTDSVVSIDESLLTQFQLIDPRLTSLQDELEDYLNQWGLIDEEDPPVEDLLLGIRQLLVVQELIRADGVETVLADFNRLEAVWDRRMETMTEEIDRERLTRDVARDRRIFESLVVDLNATANQLQQYLKKLDAGEVTQEYRSQLYEDVNERREKLLTIVQGLSVVQIDIRVELIELAPFDLSMEDAVRLGMQERLDLKNERAFVMDARRRLEVAANRLEAVLDVVVEGDVATRSLFEGNDNPFDFRGRNSSLRAGLAFTAPVVQIQERNFYRASLIEYQRARRAYMQFEDTVKFEIRSDWRDLAANRTAFGLTRQAVRSAAIQYDQAVDATTAPAQAGQSRSSDIGLNLLNSLNAILRAQDSLIGSWVSYETSRLQVNRDMGTMFIDEAGVWDDSVYQERKAARPSFIAPPDNSIPIDIQAPAPVDFDESIELGDELSEKIERLSKHSGLFDNLPPLSPPVEDVSMETKKNAPLEIPAEGNEAGPNFPADNPTGRTRISERPQE